MKQLLLAWLLLPAPSAAITFLKSIQSGSTGNATISTGISVQSSSPVLHRGKLDTSPASLKVTMDAIGALYGSGTVPDSTLVRLPVEDARLVAEIAGTAASTAYSEIKPKELLDLLQRINARKGQRFYDVGSGAGRAVVTAWAMGLNATGIELSKIRFDASCEALSKVKATRFNINSHDPMYPVAKLMLSHPLQMRFLHGSFTEIDFSDADIVFGNNAFYSEELISKLALVAGGMRKGSHFVSMKPLPGQNWKQIGSMDVDPSSNHGEKKSWILQEKIDNPDSAGVPHGTASDQCRL